MVSFCLTLGIVLVAASAVMAFVFSRLDREPRVSRKGKAAGNRRVSEPKTMPQPSLFDPDSDFILNLDAFSDPELSAGLVSEIRHDALDVPLSVWEDFDDEDPGMASSMEHRKPSMTLASLLEVQLAQDASRLPEAPNARPRILGDGARELGMRYFDYLLAHHVVPRGARHLTSEANIGVALNALKMSRQSATLSHGAVAQRIGETAVCLFEPLEAPVVHVDKALELLDEFFAHKTVFVVLANTDAASEECLAHLNPICRKYNIPKTCLYIEQVDGSFINYVEDVNNYVPSRINPLYMPQSFFSELLDYAHSAYDDGDLEAVLRTVAPLLAPVTQRVMARHDFPKVLLAQALNLMGMTYRDIGRDGEAVECFEVALGILREIEDYEALKSVMANLGITLALSKPVTQPKIELAIRRLTEVTQLNPRDDEAWLYLANSYLELYRITSAQSLLRRALRAYDKAYELAPTQEIASCMEALERQIGGRGSKRHVDSVRSVGGANRDALSARSSD